MATPDLFPVEGVVVVGRGGLGSGPSSTSGGGVLRGGSCEGWWWIVPCCEGSDWSAGLHLLGEAHVYVLYLVVGVGGWCGVCAAWVVGLSCEGVVGRAYVEVVCWGCWPGTWGLS